MLDAMMNAYYYTTVQCHVIKDSVMYILPLIVIIFNFRISYLPNLIFEQMGLALGNTQGMSHTATLAICHA